MPSKTVCKEKERQKQLSSDKMKLQSIIEIKLHPTLNITKSYISHIPKIHCHFRISTRTFKVKVNKHGNVYTKMRENTTTI